MLIEFLLRYSIVTRGCNGGIARDNLWWKKNTSTATRPGCEVKVLCSATMVIVNLGTPGEKILGKICPAPFRHEA